MLKQVAFLMPLLCAPVISHAETFYHASCSDLQGDAVKASHVVGWLNLQNREDMADRMDFAKAERDAIKLVAICAAYPEMSLRWAATGFAEVDREDSARPAAIDDAPVGSIPGKSASVD